MLQDGKSTSRHAKHVKLKQTKGEKKHLQNSLPSCKNVVYQSKLQRLRQRNSLKLHEFVALPNWEGYFLPFMVLDSVRLRVRAQHINKALFKCLHDYKPQFVGTSAALADS
nr:MAG TPA: hypothetical protein [Caudoviricetes sp.]